MKKSLLCIALLLPGVLLLSKATINFKATAIDFGEIDSGKTVEVKFEFENSGDALLKIKNVVPSCGCTTSILEKKEYKPGEKGTIPAKFNTTGYSGKVIKSINVLTDDPKNADVLLRITGNVLLREYPQAEIKPDNISFGKVKIGKSQSRKLTLTNSGNLDLKIIEISSAPEINIALRAKAVAPRKAVDLEIIFTPFDPGSFSSLAKIRTNDTRNPYVFIRIDAEGE
jgi:hypothetical protein